MTRPDTYPRTEADQRVDVTMTVNGSEVMMPLPARVTLSAALRDHFGLTGTHVGCEHGICGMCTVLVDGEAARACLLFAVQLDGAEVTTVEGLGRQDDLHPLQESFGRHHGLQCGFCTPGFLMSSYDLLSHQPEVQREELPAELSGVLCRCTGYRNIIDAVDDVAHAYREGLPAPGNCAKRTFVGRAPAGGSGTGATGEQDDVVQAMIGDHPDAITLPSGEPTIAVDVTSELSSSPEEVAAVFGDIRVLARCLPGAELTDELGEGWYAGRARISLGPVRLSFNGLANVLEQSPHRIAMLGQGRDTGGGGAQADIVMAAEPSGAGTRLTATASVFLTGRIAGFGRSLAGDVSRRMFEDFARAVDQAAQGQEPVESTPPGALTLVASAVAERIHARVATLRDWSARRRTGRRRPPTQRDR